MARRIFLLIFFVFRMILSAAQTQDNSSGNEGWFFGMNFGGYFANKKTANYYNGYGTNNLYNTIIVNYYNYQQIKENKFNSLDYKISGLPDNMRYSPAINLGFHIGRTFQNNLSVFFEAVYAKLKTTDYVTLQVYDQSSQTSEPVIKKEAISGEEERVDLNVGLRQPFYESNVSPFMGIGLNFNNLNSTKSAVNIEGLTYSIVDPIFSVYNRKQGGVGYGAFVCGGIEIKLNEKIKIDIGANISYKKINLSDENNFLVDKAKFSFNSSAYILLLMNPKFFFSKK